MDFREWLTVEMGKREMGPSDLARLAIVPQPTIFRILSGETKNPRLDTVKKIERVLRSQSPPLEQPDYYPELSAAWGLLSPSQQSDVRRIMQQHIDHNREVLAAFGGKKLKLANKRDPEIIDPTLPDFNEFTDFKDQKDQRKQDDRRRAQAQIDIERRLNIRRKDDEPKA